MNVLHIVMSNSFAGIEQHVNELASVQKNKSNISLIVSSNIIEKFYETKTFANELNENVHEFLKYIEEKHKDLFNEERRKEALNKSKKLLKKVL